MPETVYIAYNTRTNTSAVVSLPGRTEYRWSVRDRRQMLGLSQEELASRCDISRNYVGQIEHGAANISLGIARSIASALHCHVDNIFPTDPPF